MPHMGPEFEQAYWDRIDGPIYRAEIAPLLPPTVLDFHTHAWRASDFATPPSEATRQSPSLVFVTEHFPIAALQRTAAQLFPGKEYQTLCFGFPFAEMDVARNNEHIRQAISDGSVAGGLMLVRPEDRAPDIRGAVIEGRFVGLKPYWTFVRGKAQNDVLLEDMLTPDHLRVADDMGLIVLIHLPRRRRLACPHNIAALQRMSAEYPHARLVVAHVGRSYCEWTVREGLGSVAELPNVYFDTTFIQNSIVFQYLFEHVPVSRILYGSDLPASAVHGRVVCVNGVNLFVTRDAYPWSLSRPEEPVECTFMAYESLRAIRDGAERAGISQQALQAVFFRNGRDLIEGVRASLPTA